MLWRYPDKPLSVPAEHLDALEEGHHVCQQKLDGWRVEVIKENGELRSYTRHNMRLCNSLKRDDDLSPSLTEILHRLNLPNGTQLDVEWLGRRCRDFLDFEFIVCIDLVFLDGLWCGEMPYVARFDMMKHTLMSNSNLKLPDLTDDSGRLLVGIPECVTKNFRQYFEAQRGHPLSEGVVIKRSDSKLVGDVRRPATNPAWLKVRWR